MRKKLITIETITALLLLLVTTIAIFTSYGSATLNRKILLYNEDYIYYYKSMNNKINNRNNVRNVQQYLNRGKSK